MNPIHKNRQNQRTNDPSHTVAPDSEGSSLDRLRQQGDDLLRAGDAAINRGVSQDSQQYIYSGRQSGGQ